MTSASPPGTTRWCGPRRSACAASTWTQRRSPWRGRPCGTRCTCSAQARCRRTSWRRASGRVTSCRTRPMATARLGSSSATRPPCRWTVSTASRSCACACASPLPPAGSTSTRWSWSRPRAAWPSMDGGALITPDEFLVSRSAAGLRRHLADLGEFPGAARWLAQHRPALERRHVRAGPGQEVVGLARSDGRAAPPDNEGRRPGSRPDEPLRCGLPRHRRPAALPVLRRPRPGADPRVLAALLNSAAAQYVVQATAPTAKDGFRRYRRQFLLDLPVPEVDRRTGDQILQLLAAQDDTALSRAVDAVYGREPGELQAASPASG